MNITAVRIIMYPNDKLRAFATITIDNWLAIRGIKIIEGKKGLFVAMPNRQRADSTFQDIAHPITAEARAALETAILSAFEKAAAQGTPVGAGTSF
jgi:stage V sporulation protein G